MFTRPRVREAMDRYLGKLGCCAGGECGPTQTKSPLATALPVLDSSVLNGSMLNGSRPNDLDERSVDGSKADDAVEQRAAQDFFARALTEQLSTRDVFRITITSFMDAYNFDVRRVMKSCVHHILPSGHIIPFSAYNVLYREGHVPLPPLEQLASAGP